ncbi:MAG: hypothetical protein MJA27_17675 [Pseudanabaenales cyanobacterium]|nr:hypothetical protein [Pseudanabaenales cyanobacterium]
MNRNLSSILLITLLSWGLIASAAKSMQQFSIQTWRYGIANQAPFTMPIAFEGSYIPPNCGLPMRREGGGARWRQNQLSRPRSLHKAA